MNNSSTLFQTHHSPTLLLNEHICKKNIRFMCEKANRNNATLRPHAKTCQSAEIMGWFSDLGVDKITVSSIKMASYFAKNGWTDILIAFPVNIRAKNELNELAKKTKLHLTVESIETTLQLASILNYPVSIWIKVDCGYGRTGVNWQDQERLIKLVSTLRTQKKLHLEGFLAHAGNTYDTTHPDEINQIHETHRARMMAVKALFPDSTNLKLSVGDTPSCSISSDFSWADELRPGNFVFYDLKQLSLQSCSLNEIAVVMACPVVAIHQDRESVIIHGGAVHFSKDSLEDEQGVLYGMLVEENEGKWKILEECRLIKLSQEHGTLKMSPKILSTLNIGDWVFILPIHSCLTANLMRRFTTLSEKTIEMMPL